MSHPTKLSRTKGLSFTTKRDWFVFIFTLRIISVLTGIIFSGLYTSFAIVLILTRKSEMEADKRGLADLLLEARTIVNGWSMYVGWIVFVFTALSGGAWIALSIELKKTRASYNYNLKYKQICGT